MFVETKKLQKLIDNADEFGVSVKDLKELVNTYNVGNVDPNYFKYLIKKHPEPKIKDVVYHGGFPILNKDGSYKTTTITKQSRFGDIETFEKYEVSSPNFTLRLRYLQDLKYIVIGWSAISHGDCFNKKIGEDLSHFNLLQALENIKNKNYLNAFDFQQSNTPVSVFANLKFYLKKYFKIMYKNNSMPNFEEIIVVLHDNLKYLNYYCLNDIAKLSEQYVPLKYYKPYICND